VVAGQVFSENNSDTGREAWGKIVEGRKRFRGWASAAEKTAGGCAGGGAAEC
jgi:hypothetical protein